MPQRSKFAVSKLHRWHFREREMRKLGRNQGLCCGEMRPPGSQAHLWVCPGLREALNFLATGSLCGGLPGLWEQMKAGICHEYLCSSSGSRVAAAEVLILSSLDATLGSSLQPTPGHPVAVSSLPGRTPRTSGRLSLGQSRHLVQHILDEAYLPDRK